MEKQAALKTAHTQDRRKFKRLRKGPAPLAIVCQDVPKAITDAGFVIVLLPKMTRKSAPNIKAGYAIKDTDDGSFRGPTPLDHSYAWVSQSEDARRFKTQDEAVEAAVEYLKGVG